ncbi:hypothetical protein [uncultured Nocardioides sp.]|uniref:hypothetical protein n=1 Tax=uncultured Nocardioides sp. TaxID=198441 RepID=UPI00262D0731|nr:hypothetical protein [uncultured Nocardioides sp.]
MPSPADRAPSPEAYAPCLLIDLLLSEITVMLRETEPTDDPTQPGLEEVHTRALLLASRYLIQAYEIAGTPALDEPLIEVGSREKESLGRRAASLMGVQRINSLGLPTDHECVDSEYQVLGRVQHYIEQVVLVLLTFIEEDWMRDRYLSPTDPTTLRRS